MAAYIPTIENVDFEKEFIGKPVEYEGRVQGVSATDRFLYSRVKRCILCQFSVVTRKAMAYSLRTCHSCLEYVVKGARKGELSGFAAYGGNTSDG